MAFIGKPDVDALDDAYQMGYVSGQFDKRNGQDYNDKPSMWFGHSDLLDHYKMGYAQGYNIKPMDNIIFLGLGVAFILTVIFAIYSIC